MKAGSLQNSSKARIIRCAEKIQNNFSKFSNFFRIFAMRHWCRLRDDSFSPVRITPPKRIVRKAHVSAGFVMVSAFRRKGCVEGHSVDRQPRHPEAEKNHESQIHEPEWDHDRPNAGHGVAADVA